jgi:hypothetical protein
MRICSLSVPPLKHEWNQTVWSVNNLRCGTAGPLRRSSYRLADRLIGRAKVRRETFFPGIATKTDAAKSILMHLQRGSVTNGALARGGRCSRHILRQRDAGCSGQRCGNPDPFRIQRRYVVQPRWSGRAHGISRAWPPRVTLDGFLPLQQHRRVPDARSNAAAQDLFQHANQLPEFQRAAVLDPNLLRKQQGSAGVGAHLRFTESGAVLVLNVGLGFIPADIKVGATGKNPVALQGTL